MLPDEKGNKMPILRSHLKFIVLAVALLGLSACKEALYSNLDERQANEMIALLGANAIDATREVTKDGLYILKVAKGDIGASYMILSAAGLPREPFQSLGDVFRGDSVVGTPFEERARYTFALSQELSATLTAIDGVRSARVHIMIPERNMFDRSAASATASVVIYHERGTPMDAQVANIKTLVSHAVPNLSYDSVAVAMFAAAGVSAVEVATRQPIGAADASIISGQIPVSANVSDGLKVLLVFFAVFFGVSLVALRIWKKILSWWNRRHA